MTTYEVDSARGPMPMRGDAFSGALLVLGAAALFVGTLFYARLTPQLGLPALPAERAQALADALSLGAQRLALAGGSAFLGDCLLLAACIALASRGRRPASDLESAGWALMAVSVAIAMVFDSMTAALFWPLAQDSDPAPFLAFKAWFDFLFAAGNVPFGVGFIVVLWADARARFASHAEAAFVIRLRRRRRSGGQWAWLRDRRLAHAAGHRPDCHVRMCHSGRARRPDRPACANRGALRASLGPRSTSLDQSPPPEQFPIATGPLAPGRAHASLRSRPLPARP